MSERDRPPQAPAVKTRPARRAAPALARSLGPHLARLAKASGAMDPRLASEWNAIAGPELAELCRPMRIVNRGKTQALEVSVKHGAAAMKLQYSQEALLQRVRHRLGYPRLTRLVIREGAHKKTWSTRRMTREEPSAADDGPKSEGLKAALDAMRRTIHEKDG